MKLEKFKKYKLEITISAVYIIISTILYLLIDIKESGEIFALINMTGVGIFIAAMLIRLIEKFANNMIDSGRMTGVRRVEETKFTRYRL